MNSSKLLNEQLNAIVFMRFLIGWHFLYEGALKLFNPSWTAKGFLMSSPGVIFYGEDGKRVYII